MSRGEGPGGHQALATVVSMNLRRAATTLAALSLVLAGAACGDDDQMDGMSMGDPDATPADQLEGNVGTGEFAVLDTAPPGSEGAAGQAWIAMHDEGTTVTIRMTGLAADTAYMAHLHAEACAVDNGGPHFKFLLDGSDMPPNEVHLAFTSDDEGAGEVTVTNDQQVGRSAPSIVVHPAGSMDNRLACADFS